MYLNQPDSILSKLLLNLKAFKVEDKEGHIAKAPLLLWGMTLCGGDASNKAKVFWDVLQDGEQKFISANDKDFPESFSLLLDLSNRVMVEADSIISGKPPKKSEDDLKKIDDLKEAMGEEFLDTVYEAHSKLEKEEFLSRIVKNAKWILSAKTVRERVETALKKSSHE